MHRELPELSVRHGSSVSSLLPTDANAHRRAKAGLLSRPSRYRAERLPMDSQRRTAVNEIETAGRTFAGIAEPVTQLNGHKVQAMDAADFHSASRRILDEINTVIDGKSEAAKLALTVLLAQGHLLLEDVPGVGKT